MTDLQWWSKLWCAVLSLNTRSLAKIHPPFTSRNKTAVHELRSLLETGPPLCVQSALSTKTCGPLTTPRSHKRRKCIQRACCDSMESCRSSSSINCHNMLVLPSKKKQQDSVQGNRPLPQFGDPLERIGCTLEGKQNQLISVFTYKL